MIVNNNELTEKGDEIIFQTVPLFGLIGLNSIEEDITGESETLYFDKFFCYSLDGVVFTAWNEFTFDNLNNALTSKLTSKTEPVLKFKYIRSGTDESDNHLILNKLTINGQYSQPTPDFSSSNKSIYKNLVYDDINVYNLMVNLAEKMYSQGIIPQYMIRGEGDGDILIDKDYIEYWSTVAKFFSLILIHAYQFKNIFWRRELLAEFLTQKGIYFSDKDNIIEMQLIAGNFLDEIRRRGTPSIFDKKGTEHNIGRRYVYYLPGTYQLTPSMPLVIDGVSYSEINQLPFGWTLIDNALYSPDLNYHLITIPNIAELGGDFTQDFNNDFSINSNSESTAILPTTTKSGIFSKYNGEYLRLIAYNDKEDEFIYNQVNIKNFGWNLNNSSPLYKGLRIHDNKSLLKSWEPDTDDFVDLTNYPLIGNCVIVNMPAPGNDNASTLMIPPNSGIDYDTREASKIYAIQICDNIDYEISFWLKQNSVEASLEFGIETYNSDYIQVPSYDVKTTLFNKDFLPPAPEQIISMPDKFYFVRNVLYSKTQKAMLGRQPLTSLGVGTNLVMGSRTRNLFLRIKNVHATENIFIWKLQVKPLRTPFSTGFIQSGNLLEIWRKNNNQTLNNEKVDRIAQQFLLPYNTGQSVINL